jgi:hypothetical protein
MAEDAVLVSCSWRDADVRDALIVSLNCSDAVLCATLFEFIKRNLSSCLVALG